MTNATQVQAPAPLFGMLTDGERAGYANGTVAERIEILERFLAYVKGAGRRRYYSVADKANIENIRAQVRCAKRTNLWPLPARIPAFKVAAPWTGVPCVDTLEAYCGDRATAEVIHAAMLARALEVAA
jgi:hypothetical protein